MKFEARCLNVAFILQTQKLSNMIRTGWFHGYFACSCRKHYFSQIRGASSFVWNLRKAASSSRLLHVQNSYISNGRRKEITTFQRQYSNKKGWNWKVTRFNSIVLDLTELLDASIEREAFLHDLDGMLSCIFIILNQSQMKIFTGMNKRYFQTSYLHMLNTDLIYAFHV